MRVRTLFAESVAATVAKRRGTVIRTIFEIRAVIDDCRSNVAEGITAGIEIWEMAVIPMLIYNAECWQDISDRTVEELDKLQNMFIRCLMAVGTGCPIPLLLSETGLLTMKWRILEKKLLFLHHVSTLPDTALAKEILQTQNNLNLPGLAQECKDFLVKHDLTDPDRYSKTQWKRLVKGKIREQNKLHIIDKVKTENYSKINIDEIIEDDFKAKKYLSQLFVTEARDLKSKVK